jgi:hypothetical protein
MKTIRAVACTGRAYSEMTARTPKDARRKPKSAENPHLASLASLASWRFLSPMAPSAAWTIDCELPRRGISLPAAHLVVPHDVTQLHDAASSAFAGAMAERQSKAKPQEERCDDRESDANGGHGV